MSEIKIIDLKDKSIIRKDELNNICKDVCVDKSVLGKVKIFERKIGDKKLYLVRDSSNLVVFRGRRWLVQRACNCNYEEADDYNSLYISWLAIGTGGCPAGHPLSPSSPSLENIALSSHGVIESGIRYVTVGGKQYHKFDEGYPTFELDEDLVYDGNLADDDDRRIIVKTVTTLAADEANNDGGIIDPNAYQEINECGLFISNANTVSPPPTRMEMFARCTFPTIRKNNEIELIFNWYLFF